MNVEHLIKILQKQDPKIEIQLEGCDCTSELVGYSIQKVNEKKTLFLRRDSGVIDSDHKVLTE